MDQSRQEHGDPPTEDASLDDILPMVYLHLKRVATKALCRQVDQPTIQPTALVHEAYLRLRQAGLAKWDNPALVVAAAARAMRNVLVDRLRAKRAQKRGGDAIRIQLDLSTVDAETPLIDLEALDESLRELETIDPRANQVVLLRFFGGLSIEQVADLLGISVATANRDWRFVRAWLRDQLLERSAPQPNDTADG